jgi:hypothetical protein
MRNSGWYIPYWRKPKKKGKGERPSGETVERTDEQLESVRQRWVDRYRRTVRALGMLGLSMGSNRAEVQARYELLRASGTSRERELEDAYRYLMRVLPPMERRKRRNREAGRAATEQQAESVSAAASDAADETLAVVDVLVGEAEDDEAADELDEAAGDDGDEELELTGSLDDETDGPDTLAHLASPPGEVAPAPHVEEVPNSYREEAPDWHNAALEPSEGVGAGESQDEE